MTPRSRCLVLCIAGFGFFAVLPVFWTLPTAFLSGAGAAAGIAAVNSIGNLGGYFGPQIFGLLRDQTGSDVAGLIFLAGCAFVGMVHRDPARHEPGDPTQPGNGQAGVALDISSSAHLTSGRGSGTKSSRFGILIAASVFASSTASAGTRPFRLRM